MAIAKWIYFNHVQYTSTMIIKKKLAMKWFKVDCWFEGILSTITEWSIYYSSRSIPIEPLARYVKLRFRMHMREWAWRSRHSQRMHNPPVFVSDKRPMVRIYYHSQWPAASNLISSPVIFASDTKQYPFLLYHKADRTVLPFLGKRVISIFKEIFAFPYYSFMTLPSP